MAPSFSFIGWLLSIELTPLQYQRPRAGRFGDGSHLAHGRWKEFTSLGPHVARMEKRATTIHIQQQGQELGTAPAWLHALIVESPPRARKCWSSQKAFHCKTSPHLPMHCSPHLTTTHTFLTAVLPTTIAHLQCYPPAGSRLFYAKHNSANEIEFRNQKPHRHRVEAYSGVNTPLHCQPI